MVQTSAGAVLYTVVRNKAFYLVIKDFNGNYGFPKGHIEGNEDLIATARREIKEETGVDARIDPGFREELTYPLQNRDLKRSVYFLASFRDQRPVPQPQEVQKILLLPYEDALEILTFAGMKQILRKAESYRREKTDE